jgi:HK97 family phage prohead protease
MWDMWGEYTEEIAATAFDATLAAGPDVAFLTNHRGVTMARTKGGTPTLTLDADPRGLHMEALVNPARTDVRDLLTAIDDENITEMSFAFMILDWEWNEDYDQCRINSVDLDRGDVSAVNFGANPYTSIAARSQEVMGLLPHLPDGVARAAMSTLGRQLGIPVHTIERLSTQAAQARAAADPDPVEAASRGRSVALVERLLDLD